MQVSCVAVVLQAQNYDEPASWGMAWMWQLLYYLRLLRYSEGETPSIFLNSFEK